MQHGSYEMDDRHLKSFLGHNEAHQYIPTDNCSCSCKLACLRRRAGEYKLMNGLKQTTLLYAIPQGANGCGNAKMFAHAWMLPKFETMLKLVTW